MAEKVKAEETVETAKPNSAEESEHQETEETSKTIGEAVEEVTDNLDGKEVASEPLEEEEPASETTDETEDEDDVSSFLDSPSDETKKTGEQKRIDKLTARNYQLQAELEAAKVLEASKATVKSTDDEKVFTEAELDTAEKKAFEESDYNLMRSVRIEREKNLEAKLTKKYQSAQSKIIDENKRIKSEWESTQEAYTYLSAPNAPQLFPGSNEELNIKNNNSTLFRLAKALYMSGPDEIRSLVDNGHITEGRDYRTTGGQERAVTDALKIIIKKRGTEKHEGKEVKQLKKKLKKSERKRSLGTSGAEKEETTTSSKPQTPEQVLAEVISERRKYIADRSGMK